MGTGAGSFHLTNLRLRTTLADSTTEPHSLPVQFLTETGIVGLLLFVRRRGQSQLARRGSTSGRGHSSALALALPAYGPCTAWSTIGWDFAAVSAPRIFLMAGAVIARPDRARRLSAAGRCWRGERRRARGCCSRSRAVPG